MADIQALKAEIDADPLGRGYAGMSAQQVIDDLNTVYRTRNRSQLSGDEIFNAADVTELETLATGNTTQKQSFEMFLSLCARDSIDPFGLANARLVRAVFGAGSTTLSTLNTLRVENVSRVVELNLGDVAPWEVDAARAP